jgi:nucleoid-associated protein YgaU
MAEETLGGFGAYATPGYTPPGVKKKPKTGNGPAATAPKTGTPAQNLKPAAGQILLYSDERPELSIFTDLGSAYPTWTGGFGGFESVPRPKQVAITKWNGFDLAAFDVDLLFDNLEAGESVERACAILEVMGGRGGDGIQRRGHPPLLIVDTAGVMSADAHAFPDARWVVNDLDWHPDETITNKAGNRIYALVTVSLLQYNTDLRLRTQADKIARVTGPSQVVRTVQAKPGDTLQSIARRYLGDAGKWVQLQKLNQQVRDPRKLKTGQTIRVPK